MVIPFKIKKKSIFCVLNMELFLTPNRCIHVFSYLLKCLYKSYIWKTYYSLYITF